ncbi:hypothetical protein AAVH_13112 [Aphelenchoides avenae]|nr:hypothetical protein AAVH_13112 [Aphelenchus avenae]
MPTLQRQLIWSEEFDGAQLDQGRWNVEKGYLNVNNEKENYQEGNVEVRDGNLVITARRERMDKQDYTSGRINRAGKFSFTYGRAEARIKLPRVQGTWPAFWLLGGSIGSVGWPKCGEIDIMEQINTENDVFGTLHWEHNGPADFFIILNMAVGGDLPGQDIDDAALPAQMLVDYVRVYSD